MTENVDCVIIGAGVVGLACGAALAAAGHEVLVLEAAKCIGGETSSRNSEVIHAGIYYDAGSLKARLCRSGRDRLYAYCADRSIPHRRLGKLIVAESKAQEAKLRDIDAAAQANSVHNLEWISANDIAQMEPLIQGHAALFSPSTGIVDSHALMLALEGDLSTMGGMVVLAAPVVGGAVNDRGLVLRIGGNEPMTLHARTVINAAGLKAQSVALSISGVPAATIPPLHYAIGHYYRMGGRTPFSHLVYPVPEDGGLGVHLTLDLGGQAKFGPDVRWIDTVDYAFDDSQREAFVAAIRRYYPALDAERLTADYTGIRPKLSGPGMPAADFRVDDVRVHGVTGLINLFGIESPGLTASLAIGDLVASLVKR
ncbi:NAD(P)/FAD-dependent oxidoreductase [Aquisediminimonas profunda]|uniref:NAD(P)/FAD-dependent oxidoreductase n=1 Tax=Aquisediminimonas profunda TaxID=1550733 RepID=UPI001C62BEBA|nr:NAD(P)/FAD-dependent oxidoreductase [Aquisediminimonas profunda]